MEKDEKNDTSGLNITFDEKTRTATVNITPVDPDEGVKVDLAKIAQANALPNSTIALEMSPQPVFNVYKILKGKPEDKPMYALVEGDLSQGGRVICKPDGATQTEALDALAKCYWAHRSIKHIGSNPVLHYKNLEKDEINEFEGLLSSNLTKILNEFADKHLITDFDAFESRYAK